MNEIYEINGMSLVCEWRWSGIELIGVVLFFFLLHCSLHWACRSNYGINGYMFSWPMKRSEPSLQSTLIFSLINSTQSYYSFICLINKERKKNEAKRESELSVKLETKLITHRSLIWILWIQLKSPTNTNHSLSICFIQNKR